MCKNCCSSLYIICGVASVEDKYHFALGSELLSQASVLTTFWENYKIYDKHGNNKIKLKFVGFWREGKGGLPHLGKSLLE